MSSTATRRLRRDLQELSKEPFDLVSAAPVNADNLFEWHGNIRGAPGTPYAEAIFHVSMTFDHEYPKKPPKINMMSSISHPNVFGRWICLDMLEEGEWSGEERLVPYTGWTPAYTVQAMLMQLQSFFMQGIRNGEWSVDYTMNHVKNFKCAGCGHTYNAPVPALAPAPSSSSSSSSGGQDQQQKAKTKKALSPSAAKKGNDDPVLSPSSVSTRPPPPSSIGRPSRRLSIDEVQTLCNSAQPISSSCSVRVKGVAAFGIFLDFGGPVDGLLHRSEMNAETAKKIYSRGEEFDSSSLYVLRVLPESRKISLTQKEPVVPIDEATLVSHQQSGVPLKARVTNTTRDGVTVDMGGREGFVPRERLDVYDNEPLWALFDRGDNMLVRVLDITPDSSSSLSLCGRQRFYLPPPDVRAALNQNQSPPRYDPKAPKGSSARFLDSLPGPALSVVLSMLSLGDLTSIFANLSVRMRAEADGAAVRRPEIMAGLRCFFHKKGPLEMGFVKGEKTILGVGISYDRHPKTGMIQDVTSAFDPLSAEAYDIDGVRKGIWKEPFTAFLPLVIDRHHWAAAQRRIEETIMRLGLAEEVDEGSSEDTSGGAAMSLDEYKKFKEARRKAVQARMAARQERIAAAAAAAASSSSSGPAAADAADEIPLPELPQVFKFDPIVTLSVLPQLMNSQVVQLLSGDTHASVKALEGYMATHHLFLQLCHEYPELQAEVDRRTTAFRDRPSSRTKDVTPSLGDFFALLSVTDSTDWAELCEGVVEEVFDRNVLWVLKKYPHLYDPSNDAAGGKERLNRTLQANAVSLRLLCFQVWFLENVAHALHFHFDAATQTYRPCRKAVCSLQRYNRSRGLPPPSLSERLQKETKRLTSLSSWDAFFSGVRMNSPGDRMIARWLRRALLNSLRKGYHRSFPFKREVEEKSRQRTEKKAERNANDYEDDDFGIDTRSGPGAAERRRQRDERQWNQYFNQMMYPTEEGGRGGRGRGQGR